MAGGVPAPRSFASAVAALRFWRAHVLPQLPPTAEFALAHPWGLLAALLRAPSRLLDPLTSTHHRLADRAAAALTQSPVFFPRGFFCDGWGDVATPRRVRELLQSQRMREVVPLAPADVRWAPKQRLTHARACLQHAAFASTLPNAREFLPPASHDAYCELVTPLEWEDAANAQGELPVMGSAVRPLVGETLVDVWSCWWVPAADAWLQCCCQARASTASCTAGRPSGSRSRARASPRW